VHINVNIKDSHRVGAHDSIKQKPAEEIDIDIHTQHTHIHHVGMPVIKGPHPIYKVKSIYYDLPEKDYELDIITLYSQQREISESLPHNVRQTSETHSSFNQGLPVTLHPISMHQNILFCIKIASSKDALQRALKDIHNCQVEHDELPDFEVVDLGLILKGDELITLGGKQKAYDSYEVNDEVVNQPNFKIDVLLEGQKQSADAEVERDEVFSLLVIKQ